MLFLHSERPLLPLLVQLWSSTRISGRKEPHGGPLFRVCEVQRVVGSSTGGEKGLCAGAAIEGGAEWRLCTRDPAECRSLGQLPLKNTVREPERRRNRLGTDPFHSSARPSSPYTGRDNGAFHPLTHMPACVL
ncbi:hypothetical protein SKAU_G00013190 [Synaphobranchus kaupii]|uniref:Uncharacterized protein n=1 Tax=Synaphobranchus kaupii TaxID=118154 RepID=A0A9Q1GBL0_SYNKA|nr:hypothetical protein SKAU_G00013190 [Synaphobranchus kaupii]